MRPDIEEVASIYAHDALRLAVPPSTIDWSIEKLERASSRIAPPLRAAPVSNNDWSATRADERSFKKQMPPSLPARLFVTCDRIMFKVLSVEAYTAPPSCDAMLFMTTESTRVAVDVDRMAIAPPLPDAE